MIFKALQAELFGNSLETHWGRKNSEFNLAMENNDAWKMSDIMILRRLESTFIENVWKSVSYGSEIFVSENFYFKNKLSAIPKSFASERFVQMEAGPFAFPEFNRLKNALPRPRPRPTASTLADKIKT